jgi:ATP-dependent exoDNAse (exonuclease V) alpha subunit
MLGMDLFEVMLRRLSQIRGKYEPLLIVMIGDFRQLPPVAEAALYKHPCFRTVPTYILPVSHRQQDPRMRDVLQKMAGGKMDMDAYNYLNENCSIARQPQRWEQFLDDPDVPCLCAVNNGPDGVNAFNRRRLLLFLDTHPTAKIVKVPNPTSDDTELLLSPGIKVAFTSNLSVARGITNGTSGTIEAVLYGPGNSPRPDAMPSLVLVRPDNRPDCGWLDYVRSRGALLDPKYDALRGVMPAYPISVDVHGRFVTIMPLRLKYAYTIHKAQGQTLDKAIIVLSRKNFSGRLASVALSRVLSIDGIVLAECCTPNFLVEKVNNSYTRDLDEVYERVFEKNNRLSPANTVPRSSHASNSTSSSST